MESFAPKTKSEFYSDYVFRITDGKKPFDIGSWSKDKGKEGYNGIYLYFSPVIYSWISHYFKSSNDRLFAIVRPKTLSGDTMCCGLNSHYHFCFNKRPDLLPRMCDSIQKHDFSDPEIKQLFKDHETSVMQKFGKHVKDMKGGLYMGTLEEFDSQHPVDAYPELILDPKIFKGCKWEELTYLGGDRFQGTLSKKIFKLEQSLPKYGDRYRPDKTQITH